MRERISANRAAAAACVMTRVVRCAERSPESASSASATTIISRRRGRSAATEQDNHHWSADLARAPLARHIRARRLRSASHLASLRWARCGRLAASSYFRINISFPSAVAAARRARLFPIPNGQTGGQIELGGRPDAPLCDCEPPHRASQTPPVAGSLKSGTLSSAKEASVGGFQ